MIDFVVVIGWDIEDVRGCLKTLEIGCETVVDEWEITEDFSEGMELGIFEKLGLEVVILFVGIKLLAIDEDGIVDLEIGLDIGFEGIWVFITLTSLDALDSFAP